MASPAPDDPLGGGSMMRRSEGRAPEQPGELGQRTGKGMQSRHDKRVFIIKIRQQSCEAPSGHGLANAGRTKKEHMVSTRS